jgi:signal transduction histidine kinase
LNEAFDHPGREIHRRLFNSDDGLEGYSFSSGSDNPLAFDNTGRLWIATNNGIYSIDPSKIGKNNIPPPVAISDIKAAGRQYAGYSDLTLPVGISNIQIDYVAASLVNSSRIRFMYRLVGQEWVDAGTRREAIFTNLAPGEYRFQVIAANADGVWNRTGATLAFTIPPTFLQSRLFVFLCCAAGVLMAAILYWLRVRQLTARVRVRLEDRLRERERIARELHDTLLQSVQGLIYRFQNVADDIPRQHGAHTEMLEALDRADDVLAEGRERVHGLRSWNEDRPLPAVLSEVAEKTFSEISPKVDVTTTGSARALAPDIAAELLRIAEEALLNCARHAHATNIDISVIYGARRLQIRVEDDGVGIPSEIAQAGRRAGHFGLIGMRERSAKIGAAYAIERRQGGGTAITISVPADIAYADRPSRFWKGPWRGAGRGEVA